MGILAPQLNPGLQRHTSRLTDALAGGLPTPTRFVSAAATNGYAVGANAGNGNTKAAPWLTLDYAIATASPGDVIEVNDGTYQSATFYNQNGKTLTIQARRLGGVILQAAAGQTRIVHAIPNVAGARMLTLTNLILDGLNNTTRGATMGNNGAGIGCGLTLRNCTIRNVTQAYVEGGAVEAATLNLWNLTCAGQVSGRPIFVSAKDANIDINGVALSGVSTTAPNFALVELLRIAGGVATSKVAVRGIAGTFTGPGAQVTNGVVITDFDDAAIENNELTIQGDATSIGALYKVSSDNAALSAHRASVRGNRGYNGHGGGYMVLIGSDGTGPGNNNHNNPLVENNNIGANPAAGLPVHGYILGWGSGGQVRNNTATGAGHGLLAKDWTGGTFSGNTVSGFSYDGIYAKGATGTAFTDNTINVTMANSQGVIRVDWDDVSTVKSTGIVLARNTLNVGVDPPIVVFVGAGSDAAFSADNYALGVALGGATPWSYQGTGYATLAAWKAAREPTATP